MESNDTAKRKKWIDAIAAENIAEVIPELQEYLKTNGSEQSRNKTLFNLLQHLSYAAYKYDRSKTKLGTELARLTNFICTHMTAAGNAKKFFSSIYHITACLVDMKFHSEGMEVCDYLLPKYGLCKEDETITRSDIFGPPSTLWHREASNLIKNVKSLSDENYELYMTILEYDLKLTRLAYEDYSGEYLTKVLSYSKKIMAKADANIMDKHKNSILDMVANSEITLNEESSGNGWRSICELIPLLIGKDMNSTSIDSIVKNYVRYFDLFRQSIMANKKYSFIFTLWERLCEILLRRVDHFENDCATEIDQWLKEFKDWCKVRTGTVLKSYAYAVWQLFSSVINYWEECAKDKERTEHVTTDMVTGILKLAKEHSRFYSEFAIANCRCQIKDCQIKTDVANDLVLKIKCLTLLSRLPLLLSSEKVQELTKDITESSLDLIKRLKNENCEQWTGLWLPWGAGVHNIGASCHNSLPNVSISCYEYLIESIVFLVGVKTRKRLWGFEDPLGTILHRLFTVCLQNQEYDRAKKSASINCLLSQDIPETKAYRDWSNIKHKDCTAMETTIVKYLRNNELEIAQVNIDDYDLVKVCLREIKALQESSMNLSTSIMAVLDELERLQAKSADYIQGVQLLGYHSLNFETNLAVEGFLKKAILLYKKESTVTTNVRCAYAMIKFFEFVEKTRELTRNTEADMAVALRTLIGRHKEPNGSNEYDVVPAYMAINMTVTSDLESSLKEAIVRWQKLIDCKCFKKLSDWEVRYSLHAIKVAGEYARLYHFENLANDAWNMTYKLATQISDGLSIVYATSRSLTSPYFHIDWIANAEKHAVDLEDSNDRETMRILIRYRLSLANFYYENNETEKAEESISRITSNTEIKFMEYFSNFLLLKEIDLKHRLGRDENDDQSTYSRIITQYLYTLLSIDDKADTTTYGHKEEQLYNYEILLDHTNNLALRMNSLLSYREICAHLVKRLSTAQKLVASLRVAECLKFLCYIDLSRAQLEDCGVKLQGLEHILEIEAFDATMKSELLPCRDFKEFTSNFANSTRHVDVVRDVGQNDTSPVLRTKVFAKPHFMIHGDICSCFKCTNTCYQFLVFACTHIRAQLFALQKNEKAAFQHFHGAMEIKKCIIAKIRSFEMADENHKFFQSSPQHQRHIVEYIMFHLDYCRFLDTFTPNFAEEVTQIAHDALELCDKYNLHNHPLYVSINEFLFERRFKKLFTKDHYSKFMVPDIKDMDVSRYEQNPAPDAAICVTPIHEMNEKRPPISVRRRKTPPFLSLDRVPIDPGSGITSPTSSAAAVKSRRLRRKISKDYDQDNEETPEKSEEPVISAVKITLNDSEATKSKKSSNRVSSSKKNVVEKLDDIGKSHSSVAEVTKMLESTQIDGKARARSRKNSQKIGHSIEGTEKTSNNKSTKKIDHVTELMNEMSLKKKQKSDSLPATRLSDKSRNTSNNSDSSCSEKATLPSSVLSGIATSSETDKNEPIRRVSARLRKKDRDTGQGVDSKNSEKPIVPETISDDEPVVVSVKPKRRLYSSKEPNVSVTNKTVKNSRNRTTKSQDG